MKSLGIDREELYGKDSPMCSPQSDKENPTCYPSFYADPKFLTKMGLDEFEPGDRVSLTIEVVVREQTVRKNEKGEETISSQLDIVACDDPEKVGTGEPDDDDSEGSEERYGVTREKTKPRKISAKEALGD